MRADCRESPGGAAEGGQVRRRLCYVDAGVAQHGQRRQSIEHIVFAGYTQLDPAELRVRGVHGELAAAVVDAHDLSDQVAGADADDHDGG